MKAFVAFVASLLLCLMPAPTHAQGISEQSVFRVAAACPGTSVASRTGTAFLVQDWPDQGKVSLVSALHVIHGCKLVELYPSQCVAKGKPKALATFVAADQRKLRAWPEHDLVAFLDVTNEPWVSQRPKLRWGGLQSFPDPAAPVILGNSVTVNGYTQNNVCLGGAGLVTSYVELDKVYAGNRGSLAPDMRLMIYSSTATHGASGGPVALPGSDVVIGIHEAGFGESIQVTAANLVTTSQATWGREYETTLAALAKVPFKFPVDVHFLEQDLTGGEQAWWFKTSFTSFRVGATLGGSPAPVEDGGFGGHRRYHVGAAYDVHLGRLWADGAQHLRLAVDALYWPYDRVFQDPAGRAFSRKATWGLGLATEVAYLLRFRRTQTWRLATGPGLRVTTLSHSQPAGLIKVDLFTALLAHFQVSVSVADTTAILLLLSGGAECGPSLRYEYHSVGGKVKARDEPFCGPIAPIVGAAVGVEL
jgi:hypothetical protein